MLLYLSTVFNKLSTPKVVPVKHCLRHTYCEYVQIYTIIHNHFKLECVVLYCKVFFLMYCTRGRWGLSTVIRLLVDFLR